MASSPLQTLLPPHSLPPKMSAFLLCLRLWITLLLLLLLLLFFVITTPSRDRAANQWRRRQSSLAAPFPFLTPKAKSSLSATPAMALATLLPRGTAPAAVSTRRHFGVVGADYNSFISSCFSKLNGGLICVLQVDKNSFANRAFLISRTIKVQWIPLLTNSVITKFVNFWTFISLKPIFFKDITMMGDKILFFLGPLNFAK